MQNTALARTGRLGLDRDTLEAIYIGLRFYRLKQRTDASPDHAFTALGQTLDGLRRTPTSALELEAAIAQEVADAVEHASPGSGDAGFFRIVALLMQGGR